MKFFIIFSFVLITACSAFAQQKSGTDYMNITIYGSNIFPKEAFHEIVTRTDSAQLQKDIDRIAIYKTKKDMDKLAAQENTLMSALKPYFNSGWKLVSTSVEVIPSGYNGNTNVDSYIYRYYLSREKQ